MNCFTTPAELSRISPATGTWRYLQAMHVQRSCQACRNPRTDRRLTLTDGLSLVAVVASVEAEMLETFIRAAYPLPLDLAAVEVDWRREGFSFGVFRDPPGQEWNDFTHATDEYVLVAEGRLRIEVGGDAAVCEPGDLVRIPRRISHSLKTLSENGSVWLYGYGYWDR